MNLRVFYLTRRGLSDGYSHTDRVFKIQKISRRIFLDFEHPI